MNLPYFAVIPTLMASFPGAMADEVRFERINLTESASGHCLVPVTVDGHETRFFVFSVRAKFKLPEDKGFGGILGVQTLAKLDAFFDFGIYSLVIPSKFASGESVPSNP